MKTFKLSAAAAVIALGAGLVFVPPAAQAGASTGTWANGAVAGPNGRIHTPYRQGYRNYHNGPRYGYRPAPRYGYRPAPGYYNRGVDPGAAAAAGIVGLTTGAIVGGALSQQAAPSYGCTYLGRDGYRHACR